MSSDEKQVGGTHYKDLTIQPAYFCHVNKLGPLESSVIWYMCRHQKKGGAEDLKKAIHFIEMILEYDYNENPSLRR